MLFAILGPGAEAWGQTYEEVMELDMTTKEVGCAAYNATTTYGDWKIVNGANNNKGWPYFKMGGKKATLATYNPCYIYYSANSGVSSKVDKITVSIAAGSLSKSGMSVKSWGVYVYSDKAMTTQIDYVAGGTITKNAATFDFTPSAGKTWASGYYYKVSWNLANTTTTNGIVCVDKITLYKESTPSHTLTFSATNGSITASGEDEAEIESGDNVEEGATLDITATADDWYKFSGWSVTGIGSSVESTTTNPTTFTMGTDDATLTATFDDCVVTVNSNNEDWGIALYNDESHTISTLAEVGYRISTTEPYTIVPADAATLTAGDDDTFVVSGVKDQDVEITINFEALPSVAHTVFFDGNDHGTPASESITEASADAGVTLPDCTPNTGFVFKGWATTETATEADAGVVGETYYPTADITLYAVYYSVYTINYMVNGELDRTMQCREDYFVNNDGPQNVAVPAGMTFEGWGVAEIDPYTTEKPAVLGNAEHPTQNYNLYAVLSYTESVPATSKDGETWKKLTSASVITNTYYMTEVLTEGAVADATVKNIIVVNPITVSGTLEFVNGGLFRNETAAKLMFAEGAQLITDNTGVLATMKKHINGTEWYTISSPLAESVNVTDVTNLIPTTVSATDYDLYYLDEKNGFWVNARPEAEQTSDFTTIDKGRGYIYSNNAGADYIAFAGEINVEDVECTLTNGDGHGFNLIGNPFSQNITLDNVVSDRTAELAEGFYVLTNQNTWGTKLTDSEIKPLQSFLVQATTAGDVTISKPTPSSKGGRSNEQNTNIEIIVSNSNYRDNAYAMFGEGTGLNKINHRNVEAPMVYIPQGGEDFAIAFMDENTTLFPVSFKAMTTGKYSISLKATEDVNTLVLIDNQTGAETNMLLESSYSFIGSPADRDNRFTVKLGISQNNGQNDDEHFVYQYGNELVIDGEGMLQVFDVLGRVVISEEVHGQRVNIGSLIKGAYIVRMTGENVMTQKIIVK